MAKYFAKFGKLQDLQRGVVVTNIMQRVDVMASVEDNTLVYYNYDVQEGDTPEMIAEKFYGDPERHWIVMMMNDIMDPYYDWPLSYRNFQSFIDDKYMPSGGNTGDGIANASTTIHHYELVIDKSDDYDGSKSEQIYIVDANTYANTTTSPSYVTSGTITISTYARPVTTYDWEEQQNESKRSIKLLKPEYAAQMESELTQLLSK